METDSASSSGSERNLVIMAVRGANGDVNSPQNGIDHGAQTKFVGVSHSNNVGNGNISKPWGVSLGTLMGTCQISADVPNSLSESSINRMNAWGALNSSSNGGLNPSTLNSNSNRGAWPVLETNGHALQGPGGSGSSSSSSTGVASQMANNPSMNSNLGGSWGSLQENCDSQANGTRKVSRSRQPQNLNPDVNGPNNNTTNFMTSSLPNSAGSAQVNEPARSNTGPGAWCASAKGGLPLLQASPVTKGTSASHLSNGEAKHSGTRGTIWGAYVSTYSGDQCSDPSSQANSNTVNATQMQAGASGINFEVGANKGAGVANAQHAPWGGGGGGGRRGGGGGGGGPAPNTNLADGEWNKFPSNQHPSENRNGKKFTQVWKCAKEESAGVDAQSPAAPRIMEQQNSGWLKKAPGESESNPEPPEEGPSHERKTADQHVLLQSIMNRTDLDPRVLSNAGWGQTPIKQNTAWDTEASPRGERKADNGTEAWGGCVPQACSSGGVVERSSLNGNEAPTGPGWSEPKPATRWEDTKASSSKGGWGEEGSAAAAVAVLTKSNQSWGSGKDDRSSSSWKDAEKLKQGWADGQKANPGWAAPSVDSWGDNLRCNQWGEVKKSSSGSSDSDRSTSGWNEPGKPMAVQWGSSSANPSNCVGWEEPAKPSQNQVWGDRRKPNRSQSWGEVPQPPSSPDWNKQQEVGCWGAQSSMSKLPSLGWMGGPMPAPVKEEEPTGWEEPSPESIRRKMEIDDGTSAWGDPSKYNYKNVNMWNKNTLNGSSSRPEQQAQTFSQLLPSGTVPSMEEAGGGSGSSSSSSGKAPFVLILLGHYGQLLPSPFFSHSELQGKSSRSC